VFVLLLVETFRRISRQWRNMGAILIIASLPAWIGTQLVGMYGPRPPNSMDRRPSVSARIAAEPGRHVAVVHYDRFHPLGQEWVYNEPDIDHARVIWARDLGQERNRELSRYYPQRIFWLVEPDHPEPRVTRCTPDCIIPTGPAPSTEIPDR
jgi:hypothetical protein